MGKYTQNIERADLILFYSACQSATAQSQFYSSEQEQKEAIQFIHHYMVENYRAVIPLFFLLRINDFNRQLLLFELLRRGAHTAQNPQENELIGISLRQLPVHRVYKLFARLAQAGVHNRRTRSTLKAYLTWRNNLAFDVVKYRRLLRQIARHFHLQFDPETHRFLFQAFKQKFETPLYETYRQAQYSNEIALKLPVSIAEGFAAARGLTRKKLLESAQLTDKEKLRLQVSAEKNKTSMDLRPERLELTAFLLYVLSLPPQERLQHQATLELVVSAQFERIRAHWTRFSDFKTPALVLDNSYSSRGARSSRQRGLAIALGVYYLLKQLWPHLQVKWSYPQQIDPLLQRPMGPTRLADPFLDLLEGQADFIVIVSDGAENDPPQGVHKVLHAASQLWKKPPWCLHLNPVLNPRDYQPGELTRSPHLPTLGIRQAEDLFELLAFADWMKGGQSATRYWQELSQNFVAINQDTR